MVGDNIEKLAIEHGAQYVQGSGDFCFMRHELEAFAKALQSSEPVFAEYLDDDEEWQKINVKDIGTYEHAMFKTRLLFTHPPTSVSLEKYNKLLDALKASNKELHNWDDSLRIASQVVGDSKTVRKPIQKLINENKRLIAEAEGKS